MTEQAFPNPAAFMEFMRDSMRDAAQNFGKGGFPNGMPNMPNMPEMPRFQMPEGGGPAFKRMLNMQHDLVTAYMEMLDNEDLQGSASEIFNQFANMAGMWSTNTAQSWLEMRKAGRAARDAHKSMLNAYAEQISAALDKIDDDEDGAAPEAAANSAGTGSGTNPAGNPAVD